MRMYKAQARLRTPFKGLASLAKAPKSPVRLHSIGAPPSAPSAQFTAFASMPPSSRFIFDRNPPETSIMVIESGCFRLI